MDVLRDAAIHLLKVGRVDMVGNCWLWKGATGGSKSLRYGVATHPVSRKLVGTHRLFYEAFLGPIPSGLALDHLCKNTLCCNPTHLEPVSPTENNRRAAGTKLNAVAVAQIRQVWATSDTKTQELKRDLAFRFGVSPWTIHWLIYSDCWDGWKRPTKQKRVVLSDEQRESIRTRYAAGERAVDLAREFGLKVRYTYCVISQTAASM